MAGGGGSKLKRGTRDGALGFVGEIGVLHVAKMTRSDAQKYARKIRSQNNSKNF